MGFPFSESVDTMAITCQHIIEEGKPILYVSHDADDGMWQFLCGREHMTSDSLIVSLHEIYKQDNTIASVADLPLGCYAERITLSDNWIVGR